MKFERVFEGVQRYAERELCPKLASWQAVAVGFAVGRMGKRCNEVKNVLQNHPMAKLLGVVDAEGNVDITEIYNDLKVEVQKRQTVVIEDVPLIGDLKFGVEDVDKMYRIISGGEQ